MRGETLTIKVTAEKYDLGDVRIPSLGRRFGAFFIDVLAMFLLPTLILVISSIATGVVGGLLGIDTSGMSSLFVILWFLLVFGYFPLFEYFNRGQTIGRKIAGIQLLGYSQTGDNININYERIGLMKLILRNIFKLVWYFPAPIIFPLIAFILMYDDKLHRAFYDKVLKTIVIQIK